jgi:hypothetical protein
MTEFLHTPLNVRVRRIQKDEAAQMMEAPQKGRAVRLYCTESKRCWHLQVRGPIATGFSGLREGKDFAIASAYMTRDDLLKLRAAIDAQLSEG